MPAVHNVLVVGGGLAGTAAAIGLAAGGVAVDLVEVRPEVQARGCGLTLQGNALRELDRLGVWERARARLHHRAVPRRPRRERPADPARIRAPLLRPGGQLAQAGLAGLHARGGATEHIGLDHLPYVSTFIADWIADTFAAL